MTRTAVILGMTSASGLVLLIVLFWLRGGGVGDPTFSRASWTVIGCAGALLTAAGFACAQFLDHKRRYSEVPPRRMALFAGSLGVMLGALVVTYCLPGVGDPATTIKRGGWVIGNSGHSRSCSRYLDIQYGEIRDSVCVCRDDSCVRGIGPPVSYGSHVDFQISSNWAGYRVVGIVPNGA
jgi:lipid-A-disaccharide synthase-like uncharacterized protein